MKTTKNWDRLAKLDPMWVALTEGSREWDRDSFLNTGVEEVRSRLGLVTAFGCDVPRSGSALDFGCGPGRLVYALAQYFESVVGIDASETMIDVARKNLEGTANAEVRLVKDPSLSLVSTGSIDFIYSNYVLQHIKPRYVPEYLASFARITAPDGVISFHLPLPRARVDFKTTLRAWVPSMLEPLLHQLRSPHLPQMEMHGYPAHFVVAEMEKHEFLPVGAVLSSGFVSERFPNMFYIFKRGR